MIGLLVLAFCAAPFLAKLMLSAWRTRRFFFAAVNATALGGALLLLSMFMGWQLWLTLAAVTLWAMLKPSARDLTDHGVFGPVRSVIQPPKLPRDVRLGRDS